VPTAEQPVTITATYSDWRGPRWGHPYLRIHFRQNHARALLLLNGVVYIACPRIVTAAGTLVVHCYDASTLKLRLVYELLPMAVTDGLDELASLPQLTTHCKTFSCEPTAL